MTGKDRRERPRVLVTGAAGRLGGLAAAHLRSRGCDVVATDIAAGDGIVAADLTRPATEWARLLDGVDAVLHAAGHRGPDTDWATAQQLNLDLSLRLMAAARGRVGRFVFLSSNWVMAGYRFSDGPIASSMPPDPINPYGMAKLAIERAGLAQAEAGDFEFVALRIGLAIADPAEAAERLPSMRRWSQAMWLSGGDFRRGVEKAIFAPLASSCVLNLMSANPGMRWDLDETGAAIGHEAEDGWRPSVRPALDRAEATFARLDRARRAAVAALTAGSAQSDEAARKQCIDILSGVQP